MKNQLSDLNNHLFAQLERLGAEDISPEKLKDEISRSKAMTGIATAIIENANLVFEAQKEFGNGGKLPEVLGIEHDDKGRNS